MISIIVSSYNTSLFNQFEKSINKTIGLLYEIIRIENPGLIGICEAYNNGGEKAQFPYLCFAHEDLIFHTQNWGQILIQHFLNNNKLGLVGVAGSAYKPYVLSGWGSTWGGDVIKMNFYQSSKQQIEPIFISTNPNDKSGEGVVTLDGCFLCTKKSIFASIKFDQINFEHYHCYDIDYSMTVSEKYDVEVVYDILLTHLSTGGYNQKWLDETVKLHKKWEDKLPYSLHPITTSQIRIQEIGAFYSITSKIIELNYGYKYLIRINFSKKFINLLGFRNWFWLQIKLPKNIFNYLYNGKLF